MTDLPLHPTLFFSFAIMTGIIIAPLLVYTDKKLPIENSVSNATHLLNSAWILGALFAVLIYLLINQSDTAIATALAPLGMMIAALIASASVMKNIAETKANDLTKGDKEKERKRIFALNVMKTIYTTIDVFISKHINDQDDMTHYDLVENSQVIQKMLDLIFVDDILPYLSVDQQKLLSDIYIQYCDFTVKYIHTNQSANPITWAYYAIDRYNHFKIFSEEYIETSKEQQ